MDSDEEIHDVYDGDSAEDYYYSGGDSDMDGGDSIGGGAEDEDNDDAGYGYGYASDEGSEKTYTVLREDDIRQRQEESISHVSAVLSISRVAASILLCHYKWNVSQLHDQWFADEDRIRKSVGLLSKPVVMFSNANELTCGICFDSYPRDQIQSAVCGHPYCITCWKGYITTSINDGPGCLLLRCPAPGCGAAVGHDMIHKLASDEDREKYSRYFVRSYIVDKKKTKWCPAPDCENAVEFELGSNIYDVKCLCSHAFCWNNELFHLRLNKLRFCPENWLCFDEGENEWKASVVYCTEEAHRPVDCSTVAKWILKNSAESENMNWILANSKPCPKCKRPIEKNQGCMHMSCTPPCKFEFCWLCLGAWSDHGERTGGFYACNRYEAAKQEGLYDESEKRREMAKNSLERYTHYYERWASNQTSRQKAIADLHQMQTVHLEKLSDKLKEPESQLKFIIEAWQQIIECRRVLKWTYAYGYYLPDHETAKRQLFEYSQGEAEAALERLHQCAEKELLVFLGNDDGEVETQPDFETFRPKLAGLTRVTRSYFENLVRALENGLSEVDSQAASSASVSSKNAGAKGKGGKAKSSSSRSSRTGTRNIDDLNHWNCERCTYANPDSSTLCQMCRNPR